MIVSKPVQVRLSERLIDRLRLLAEKEMKTMSQIIREAIEAYLDKKGE